MSKGFSPPVGFHFKVSFLNNSFDEKDNAFQEVSGISMELETEEIREGGAQFSAHKVPKQTKFDDLVLKRGLITMSSSLALWCFDTLGTSSMMPIISKQITVQLLNDKEVPKMTWSFHDAYPFKWEVSGFNAQESNIVVESISFKYNHFVVIPS
ncbi:MAG: phage tail protein [Saprospiraceae bacterium]|jgi:phage tail-like protein|nr:phage tail protein [Saprospiraceae bacterium]